MNLTSRDELPKFFVDRGYKIGAEIGVYKGEFTEKLCMAGLKIYAIDPYIVYKDYRKHPKELPYDELFINATNRLSQYDCTFIKKTSMEALEDIADGSLDFVYIDGNHSFPYISQDIYEWNRKVRVGGIISGHDYFNDNHNPYWIRACHVKYAVDACKNIFKTDLQIIGEKDKYPSWLWTKV
jgi:hypothetical protein